MPLAVHYAYSLYEITKYTDDWVTVYFETNDDGDTGYPGVFEFDRFDYKTKDGSALEKALKHTGKSRLGIGQRVIVKLDGKVNDLTNRQATCSCGALRPSSPDLAFFEFRGEGSHWATDKCANCRYAEVAHRLKPRGHKFICDDFVPHGPWEYDIFYCGHAGWD